MSTTSSMHHINDILKDVIRDLQQSYRAAKEKFGDVLQAIGHFLKVQLDLLPQRIRNAIRKYRRFERENPRTVKAIKIAVVMAVITVILYFLLPPVILSMLNWIGFGPSGPVAGSAAPAIQSAVYGAYTNGLFSVAQSIAMTGNAQALATGITAAVWGVMFIIPCGGRIRQLVEGWVGRAIEVFRSVF